MTGDFGPRVLLPTGPIDPVAGVADGGHGRRPVGSPFLLRNRRSEVRILSGASKSHWKPRLFCFSCPGPGSMKGASVARPSPSGGFVSPVRCRIFIRQADRRTSARVSSYGAYGRSRGMRGSAPDRQRTALRSRIQAPEARRIRQIHEPAERSDALPHTDA